MERRYVRRPVERNLSAKIEALVPDARLYSELREAEQSLDACISRKKLDLEDALGRQVTQKKKLRVFVTTTPIDQPWQTMDRIDENTFDFDIGAIPSWQLRIEGRLLDDDGNALPQSLDDPARRKFSSFFQNITVELDRPRELYGDSNVIVWSQPQPTPGMPQPPPVTFDGMDIKRKGDTNVRARILLYLRTAPEKYKLSPALAAVIGSRDATRQQVVMGLWQYVKYHELQDEDERRKINLDDALKELFAAPPPAPPQMPPGVTSTHLLPLDPIVIEYTTIVDDQDVAVRMTTYDIEVDTEDSQRMALANVLGSWTRGQDEIVALDDEIGLCIQALNSAKLKRDFFSRMAQDPANFVNRWMASQARDLEVVLGDRDLNGEETRRADYYTDEELKESIFLMLNRA
ncbi:uncharacterized protein V1510DRAFT_359896 [Dipodascopsis tothii]|uniref:uncharacterized protein n=1 Tax=Dipodascopsis tothii TaxID=44089 RepID=UPI0034CEF0E4